ncbi:MAG TPA: oligosaccharide flippase family protein [Candidatus Kapabacteria bacterium]|nr:oligosaccharide flippase family protein [Candidatus Kapabacteria bacterium]
MQLRDHLDKGIWAIADKVLLLLYGFAVIIVVVNVLPEKEWGVFSIYQSIFLILSVLADSIFLQPMVKFASEHEAEVDHTLAASFNLYSVAMMVTGISIAFFAGPISEVFKSPELYEMLPFLPLLIFLSIFRSVGIRYLQVYYRINSIFWVDLSFFGSIIVVTVLGTAFGLFHSAFDFMIANIIGAAISSATTIAFCAKAFRRMPIFSVPAHEYSRLYSFAKYQAGTSALLTLQQWSDTLLVGAFYTPHEAGIYSAAKNLYRFIDAVREGATLLVVPVSSRLYTEGNFMALRALVEKLLFISFAALIPISIGFAIFAEPIMSIVYRGKYEGVASVFQVLILAGFTLPLSLISTNVLIGMGKTKSLFLATLGAVIIFFILSLIFVPPMASMGAALAVFISMTVLALLTFFAMRKEVDVSTSGILSRASNVKQFVRDRLTEANE